LPSYPELHEFYKKPYQKTSFLAGVMGSAANNLVFSISWLKRAGAHKNDRINNKLAFRQIFFGNYHPCETPFCAGWGKNRGNCAVTDR
jgi:hypothetical protein